MEEDFPRSSLGSIVFLTLAVEYDTIGYTVSRAFAGQLFPSRPSRCFPLLRLLRCWIFLSVYAPVALLSLVPPPARANRAALSFPILLINFQ